MAKFYGKIGFVTTVETAPDVYRPKVEERSYCGDIIRNNFRRNQSPDQVNDGLSITNEISIIGDPFARENAYAMRYVEYLGTKWKISSFEVLHPRISIFLGGVYNGE